MAKVSFCDKLVFNEFKVYASSLFGFISGIVIFVDIPASQKIMYGILCIVLLIVCYIWIWKRANKLREINITIEESNVIIKTGDIFKQDGLKVIPFNEYFDTQVDEKIIAETSLNGKFIKKYLQCPVGELDDYISNYQFDIEEKKRHQ
ncbi:macro domain-containing protein [Escherichia coli]|uniref:macro domain-containing protein n=1 Tax=Escherichia coli TaxID=562 RepID=UPI003CE818DF